MDGNGSSVEIQFNSAGSRFVIYAVTNDAGLSTSKSVSITVLTLETEELEVICRSLQFSE